MKNYKKYLALAVLVVFLVGCGQKVITLPPEIVTVYKDVKVNVPTKVKRPDISCEFKGEGTTPIIKLTECISKLKLIIEEVTIE